MGAASAWAIISLFVAIFLTNCANPIAPTGGARDEAPPRLLPELSTPNRQVRFKKQDIVLAFDEWVQLKDAFNQVVVSPPLEFRPTVERKKRTIQFKFDEREALRDSATYIINFGDAIQDLTEGNKAEVVFVFSTGDYIDSLSIDGNVADAYTGEPVKDVIVMLYENLADSVFRTERPFYFSKTDEQGRFKIGNMKSGTFKAVALVENNLNYRFDSESEKIAFLDSNVVLAGVVKTENQFDSISLDSISPIDSLPISVDSLVTDTSSIVTQAPDSTQQPNRQPTTDNGQPSLSFRLFQEEPRLFLISDNAKNYGQVKLAFNRTPHGIELSYDTLGQLTYIESKKDTTIFWYSMEADEAFNIYAKRDTTIDTVDVKSGIKTKFYENAKLALASKTGSKQPILTPKSVFKMEFNHPLFSVDETTVQLLEDSLKTPVSGRFSVNDLEKRKLLVEADWKEGLQYEAVFPPNAITDIFGLQNTDTIRTKWTAGKVDEFGSLTLRVTDLRPDTAYIIRLLAKNGDETGQYKFSDSTSFQTKQPFLAPDVYSIEIIEDLDRNGRWTTGNYELKRQPERVQKATLEEVRANWEVDAVVQFTGRSPVGSKQSAVGSGPPTNRPGGSRE